ncbi:pentatricopeptide repeat-containing protein At4g19191, mitochondrial-like [Cornus florida]|uniref:pentatricopeptide repeat-containing protein At4g19191, mitochondrial-like n=1 Tax=Cornus florida TaxID=4283 RepID=UPI00289CAED3|nr:pentatricopeptide repeat-containing protein At4g19191, mitochondrial-like [Cornus florida]
MFLPQRPTQLINGFPPRFKLFNTSQTHQPNPLSSLLDLCNNPQHLQQIHARFILHGLHQNQPLSSKLIDTYANLGHFTISQQVFSSVTCPNTPLYNRFLRNLFKFGEFEKTLLVYQEMFLKSMYPDEYTYPFVLRSCSQLSYAEIGKIIHGHVVKLGFDSYDIVGRALAEMYREIGNHGKLIEERPINWNSLIFEACRSGDPEEGFQIFKRMRMERLEPDSVCVINLLRASVDLNFLKLGRSVHSLIIVCNLFDDLAVNTALLTMYTKLGCLEDATLLFEKMSERDCVVWNLMISAYSRNGYPEKSLELLMRLVRSGIRADLFTAIAAISSIADLKSLCQGKQIHAHVIRNGSDYQVSVHNSLIDMYCKCDCLNAARKIFDLVREKTVVSWSSMIKGYVSHELFYDALSLFTNMKLDGYKVDSITVINILPACVNIGALEQVKHLHGFSIKCGLNSILSVNTALLISYAKCGCIEMARRLFDDEDIDSKDMIIWNSMISAYSKHGDSLQCFELYDQMKQSKLKPDQVTFLGLLTACVNSGSVKEGWEYYKEMTETYCCQPRQEHYACMVDLLGRAGQIREASELINSMPFKPDARVWGPLLSACKMHSQTRLAEFAAEKLITMEPKNAGNYVLLSNIYAAAGKWEGVAKMRIFLRDKGLKKTPGCSWLEINGQVHEFRVADRSHPKTDVIYTILQNLEFEIKEIRSKY